LCCSVSGRKGPSTTEALNEYSNESQESCNFSIKNMRRRNFECFESGDFGGFARNLIDGLANGEVVGEDEMLMWN
jgi:hypothetical protein